MAGKTVQERKQGGVNSVDPRDEPSAEWGWHGSFPKLAQIGGWISAVLMFVMIYNNHENNTENVWLVGGGLAIIVILLLDLRRQRRWRR